VNCVPLLDGSGHITEIIFRSELGTQIALSTPHMGEEELQFVHEAFETNWIAPLGPNVDAFEQELADKVGAGHAAALSSGTAAIHLGLRILDVGPGDNVFCSSLTFAASANPICYLGAKPVFIDADPLNWNMCPAALEQAFAHAQRSGEMPKAVIVVNLYGQSADLDPILAICDAHGVPVIEDAAESLGATYKGRPSGTLGAMGIFSFNGNKIITTSGGGMLVSENEEWIARARFLATQAREPAQHYEHNEIGYNYRMSNILAGVGRGQLRVLDERIAQRRAVFAAYEQGLKDIGAIDWMAEPDWSFSNRWLSVATFKGGEAMRNHVIAALAGEFIEARPVWKPMHLQPVFRDAPYFTAANQSVSDELFASGICLPSGSNLSEGDIERTITVLRDALT
jgi:dTDP-4-amino-4,6-dideoxygalactose transaminase